MRKVLFILLSLAVVFGMSSGAFAKNGLSAGLALGINGNPGNLATTIVNDGLKDSAGINGADATQNSLFNVIDFFGNGSALFTPQADYTAFANWYHFDEITLIEDEDGLKDDNDKGEIKDLTTSGSMTALDIAIHVKYNLMQYLWARLGFNYTFKIAGGETSWKDNTYGYAGTQKQEWDYKTWAIPLSVGLNLPLADGKYDIYVGLGLTYVSGGFDIKAQRSYFTSTTGAAGDLFTLAINGDPTLFGAKTVSETVEFRYSGIGYNYLIGVDAEVAQNIKVFVEWETTLAGAYDEYNFENAGLKTLIGQYTKFTFVGGQVFRVGVNYWIMDPLGI